MMLSVFIVLLFLSILSFLICRYWWLHILIDVAVIIFFAIIVVLLSALFCNLTFSFVALLAIFHSSSDRLVVGLSSMKNTNNAASRLFAVSLDWLAPERKSGHALAVEGWFPGLISIQQSTGCPIKDQNKINLPSLSSLKRSGIFFSSNFLGKTLYILFVNIPLIWRYLK